MRRLSGVAVSCCLLLLVSAAPAVAAHQNQVDCKRDPGALAPAITAANPGAMLVIVGTCVGNFVIDKDLTLDGHGGNARLDARGSGTVLLILYPGFAPPAVNLTVGITGLTIAGGDAGIGIGEFTEVTLEDLKVAGNAGNGLELGPRSFVTLHDSNVSDNTGDGITNGGLAVLTVQNSTVSNNAGNGISNFAQGSSLLYDSTVSGNSGRGIQNLNAASLLDNSTVRDNAGGGIYSDGRSYLFVTRSRIVANTAAMGGGIYLDAPPDRASGGVSIEDTTIENNTAGTSGGGIYNAGGARAVLLDNVTIKNNTADTGGGIYHDGGGVLVFTDVLIRNNRPDDCFGC